MKKTLLSDVKSRRAFTFLQMPLVAAVLAGASAEASTDYGPAVWRPACDDFFSSGYGKRFYVIHDMEGYYAYCVSSGGILRRCDGSVVTVHYCVNGKKDATSDYPAGEISQLVRDSYYAWHARCWSAYSMGTEHEGFASNPAWYTEAMYTASAGLTSSKCSKYGIPKDRNHVIAHGQKSISAWRTWMSAQGYSSTFINCNTHSDPGPYWNWSHYMDLVKGTVSTPSAPSGLIATAYSTTQINLSWTDNSSIESGFKVERGTASAGPFTQIATTAANIKTYASTGLASGTTYYYRVRAYNASGNSAYSGVAHAMTKDTIPIAPTSLTAAAASSTQINLAWAQTSPNEDGFRIYRSSDNVTFTLVGTVGINVVAYNDTGLTGNRLYYYKVAAYNTAGNSAYSNTASDTTAPEAPSALVVSAVAGATNWNKLQLTWTDNSSSEVGFKVERGTALAGPFTQIGTTAAGVANYLDSGLAATTTYYYRVLSYNANGNSAYSAVVSKATGNSPPILAAIGAKTVASGVALTFTATATDPNAPAPVTTTWQTFESFTKIPSKSEEILFNKPANSATTASFIDTALTNYTYVVTGAPAGNGSTKVMKVGWTFKTGLANYWVRLNTFNTPTNMNPTIALDQKLQFKIYSTKSLKVGLGLRETGTTAAYGANGGTTGSIEWASVTNVVSGNPQPSTVIAATNWTTVSINIPFAPQKAFTGDGQVTQTGKGTLEHLALAGNGGTGAYTVYLDDFAVVTANNLTYSLDAGAPAGATIGVRNGAFKWTPTAGQVGTWDITVRVTDSLGGQDFETITVTVTGTGNHAPVLAAIGNKTVNEGSALAFTATATDVDSAQTKTFTLDAGNPSGSSITTAGAFSWTPTEAQGPGSYPITVRVTDNGSPVSNDFETITVTVNEANVAPSLAAISNQTINEGATLNLTASATDSDVPANIITYSIAGPVGMTINPSSGAISYTPGENDGGDIDQVTVTARDNGNPALSSTRTFTVTTTEVNNAPALTVGSMSDYNPFAQFDELDDEGVEGHNNACLFRVPHFSSTTSAFMDVTSYSYITNAFPQDDVNGSYQALYVNCNFKTGTTNPWLRLSTYTSTSWTNFYAYPNPTIALNQHVRFKIWANKSIKVALGVRETGTLNPIGFNGGITGALEWVGASNSAGTPVPTRTVAANSWVQLDFNLPTETVANFSGGNGVLAAGKGVLEHLAIVPNGGMGSYTIYVDDFETLNVGSSPITIDTGDTLTFACTSTDSDIPAQDRTYSLGAGAPTNAVIDETSGVFSWKPTPDQSPSTNVITLIVTDNGSPALSSSQNITVIVRKVNTPPQLTSESEQVIESTGGAITFDAFAQDDDVPAQTITYTMTGAPTGATLNPSTGTFTWTPPAGTSTNTVTIRATDNGTPALWDEQTVTLIVVPGNTAPVLNLGVARATEKVVSFESLTDMGSERVMFNKPSNSSTTSSFVDTTQANTANMTNVFPAGNANAGSKVFKAQWTFKTGTSNPWIRLNTGLTGSPIYVVNPTINASARLKFDIYTTKSLKVCLGIRETGTTAENGANGGNTGTIEFVGAASKIGSTPQPTRTINASNWTTVEFDLPNEPKVGFTGDGVLTGGQQVLEELAIVGISTGAHTLYLDNFEVVTTTALPGTVTMKANSSLTFTASATDPDPGSGISFGLDADFTETHPTATLDQISGVFTWTPGTADVGTSSSITVIADDSPTNGGHAKSDSETLTVIVNADTLGVQSGDAETASAGPGETVTIEWTAVIGKTYLVQYKDNQDAADWNSLTSVVADSATESLEVSSGAGQRFYRVVEAGDGASEQ